MPLPPGFATARYIDIRMSFLTTAFNDVVALTDVGAIVVARGAVNTPDGRVYSPLAVIDGSYVEISYSGDVICAVRGDGNIQCFQAPSAALAPATGLGWNNMTAVLTAPSSLCGPLGPHTCISAGGGPYRSVSIGNPNVASKLTVCAIQVSTNMPFCFGGNGYVTQLPNLQPAFQSSGMMGQPVSALQQISGLFFGTALWGRLMNGTQVAEMYTGTGPSDQSQLWKSAGCASFRGVGAVRTSEVYISDVACLQPGGIPSPIGPDFATARFRRRIGGITQFFRATGTEVAVGPGGLEAFISTSTYWLSGLVSAPLVGDLSTTRMAALRGADVFCYVEYVTDVMTLPSRSSTSFQRLRCHGSELPVRDGRYFPGLLAPGITVAPFTAPATNVTSLAGGSMMMCAVITSGAAWCWDDGVTTSLAQVLGQPVFPSNVASGANALAVGSAFVCARRASDASVSCAGTVNSTINAATGSQLASLTFSEIAAADAFFCGVLTNSSLVCVGTAANTTLAAHGTLQAAGGLAALAVTLTGPGIAAFAGPVSNLTCGTTFCCMMTADTFTAACLNANGSRILPPVAPVAVVRAGAAHACAVMASDWSVVCGGNDTFLQTSGPGAAGSTAALGTARSLVLTAGGTCAFNDAGANVCWGAMRKYWDTIALPTPILTRMNATSANVWVIDPSTANTTSCTATARLCTTLNETVAAIGRSGLGTVILVVGVTSSPPVAVPTTAPPLFIVGVTADATINITAAAGSASNTTAAITANSDFFVLARLALRTSSSLWGTALTFGGSFVTLNAVSLTGWNTTRALIAAQPLATVSAGAAAVGSYPSFALVNSSIANNTAPVVLLLSSHGHVQVSRVVATGPTASDSGFCVCVACGRVEVVYSTIAGFRSAQAVAPMQLTTLSYGLAPVCVSGGVTVASTTSVTVTNTAFSALSAVGCGAALHHVAEGSSDAALSVNNGTFADITASSGGAAVSWQLQLRTAIVSITNSTFTNTTSITGNGGGLGLGGAATISLANVTATMAAAARDGGFMHLQQSTAVFVYGLRVSDGRAGGSGGCVAVIDVGAVIAVDSALTTCRSVGAGGAWATVLTAAAKGTAHATNMQSTTMQSSVSAAGDGGCFSTAYVGAARTFAITLLLNRITLRNCSAAVGSGGSLAVATGQSDGLRHTVTITNSQLADSSAQSGGCLACVTPTTTSTALTVMSSVLQRCSTTGSGGAVAIRGFSAWLTQSTISNSVASGSGGAVSASQSSLTVSGGVISNNTAATYGGGISVSSCTTAGFAVAPAVNTTLLTVPAGASWLTSQALAGSVTVFDANRAIAGHGGAIAAYACSVAISSAAAINNAAQTSGGAIAVQQVLEDGRICISGLLAANNTAGAGPGGALFVRDSAAGISLGSSCASDSPACPAAQPWSRWLQAMLANASIPIVVRAAEQLRAVNASFGDAVRGSGACIDTLLVGNMATHGADVAIPQSTSSSTTAVQLRGFAAVLSAATVHGGSVYLSNLGAANISSGAAVEAAAGAAGGAVFLSNVVNADVTAMGFVNTSAARGGALAFERAPASVAARAALTRQQVVLGSLSLNACSFNAPRAAAGGCQFADFGPAAACASCTGVATCTATAYGAAAATTSRTINIMSSLYAIPATSVVGTTATFAVGVVPSVVTQQPAAVLNITDALGQLVVDDNTTTCTLSGTRHDTGGPVPFGTQAVYTAVGGLVSLYPFSVQLGTGINATIDVACTNTALGGTFDTISFGLQTSYVALEWATSTLAASTSASGMRMLPSSAFQQFVAADPVQVVLADSQGAAIAAAAVDCSLSVASAFDATGASAVATLLPATAKSVSGVATFWPSIRADANTTVLLTASCTWVSGDRVASRMTLRVVLADVRTMVVIGPLDACAPPAAFRSQSASLPAQALRTAFAARCNATNTTTVGGGWGTPAAAGRVATARVTAVAGCSQCFLADATNTSALRMTHASALAVMAVPCMVIVPALDGSVPELQAYAPAALPSSIDSDAVQILQPFPVFALVDVTAPANVTGGSTATLLTGDSSALACKVTLARAASGFGPALQAVGESTVDLAGGYAVFERVGGAGTQLLGKSADLVAGCSWITGQVMPSARSAVVFHNLTARWLQQPPTTVAPSTLAILMPMEPAPLAIVEARAADGSGSAPPLAVAASVSVVETAAGHWESAGSLRLLLTGGATTMSLQTTAGTGVLNTTGQLPVTGAFGAVGYVSVTFSWLNGDKFTLLSAPFSLFNLTARWVQHPPLLLVPSTVQSMTAIAGGPVAAVSVVDAIGSVVGLPPAVLSASVSVLEDQAGTWGDGGTARILTPGGLTTVSLHTDLDTGVLNMTNALVIGGSFGASLQVAVTFTWPTGEPFLLLSGPLSMVAANLTWAQRPAAVRYGDKYSLRVCLSGGGGAADALIRNANLGCTLSSSYVTGGSGTVPVTGQTSAVFSGASGGCGDFSDVAWSPSQPADASQPGTTIALTPSCAIRGLPVRDAAGGSFTSVVAVPKLSVAWITPPPAVVFPSAADPVAPWGAAAIVTIIDDTGAALGNGSQASCNVAISHAGGYTGSADIATCGGAAGDYGLCSRLVGTRVATMEGPAAVFDGAGVDAPFGSWAVIRAACTRPVGGTVFAALANVTVSPVYIEWRRGVSTAAPTALLYNTPLDVAVAVTRLAADGATRVPVVGITCTIAETSGGNLTMSDAALTSAQTDHDGVAAFLLAVSGDAGARGTVTAACTAAGRSVAGGGADVLLDESSMEWAITLPAAWMPSTPTTGGRNPLPPAAVRLTRVSALTGAVTRDVDTHMLRCRVSVVSGEGSVMEGPPAGYVLEASTTVDVDANGVISASGAPPTLPLTSIMILRSGYGGSVTIGASCTRRQGDTLPLLTTVVRFPAPALAWLSAPPATMSPQQAFSASLALVDADADGALIALDNSTQCTLQLADVADTSIVLVNGASTSAVAGVVRWAGAAISARAGMAVSGTATCAFPGLPLANASLAWSVQMIPCGAGTIAVGYGCQVCSTGTWSPGGAAATDCITCPSVGVTCTGGHVLFTPGYFRTDGSSLMDARDTVDVQTELTECLNADACVVNASASSMAGNVTHHCADGYEGPLCSTCQAEGGPYDSGYTRSGAFVCVPCTSKSTTAFLVILVTGAQIALIVWVAIFRTPAAEGESRGLFKVLITYIQTIGILFSFGARATESFRAMFSFSLAVSASPLALPPVACALRATFYSKWAAVVTLPLLVGAIAIAFGHFARSALGKRISAVLVSRRQAASRSASMSVRRLVRMPPPAIDAASADAHATTTPAPPATIDPVSSCIFVITLYLPNITTSCFNLLNCLPYKVGGVQYLAGDLTVDCNAPTHKALSVVAILLIVSLGLGLPAAFAWHIRRQRDHLDSDVLRRRYGDLYTPYKPEFCFWESLVFVRTTAVVAIGSLVTGDAYMQSFAAILLFIASLVLQAMYSPYKYRVMNVVETMAQCGILLTMLTTVFYLRTSNRLALCSGHPDEMMVALDKGGSTSCSTVRASATRNDLLTTLALIAINLTVVGAMAFIAARTHLLEMANATPTAANRWRRQTAQCVARLCGCVPPPQPVAPAKSVSAKPASGHDGNDVTTGTVQNPLQSSHHARPTKPPIAAAAVVVMPPAPDKAVESMQLLDLPQRTSMRDVTTGPRSDVGYAPVRVASKRDTAVSLKEKEAFEPVANASAKAETA